MIHRIHNTFLEVAASDLGAELMSIRSVGGREYLWQGDPAYWKGRSPTIFPYVARLNKGTYLLEGREYHLPIHGFARTSVFALEARTEDSMTFLLESTPELLEMYPFRFRYHLCYRLAEDTLRAEITVENLDDKTMFFGFGGHPGIRVPLEAGLSFQDYTLEFTPCQPRRILFDGDCMVSGEVPYPLDDNRIPLRHDLFDDDAIVLKNAGLPVTLKSEKGSHGVTMEAPGLPYIGFWHKPKTDAPFVCLEPWSSLPSRQGITEDLATQPDLISLPAGKTHTAFWSLRCF